MTQTATTTSTTTLNEASPALLRKAAERMTVDADVRWCAVAAWLVDQASGWEHTFAATQRPSAGVDCPPAVNYGQPDRARESADWHGRHALNTATTYLSGR
jgi:hypothetical protein